MKSKKIFLDELYKNRVNSIPFIEYFQKDKDMEKLLFEAYLEHEPSISEANHFKEIRILEKLEEINTAIEDFELLVLRETDYNSIEEADTFTKNILNKLKHINISKLTKSILNDFIESQQNIRLESSFIAHDFHNVSFYKRYSISIQDAQRKYREIKSRADNNINEYLKESIPRIDDIKKSFYDFISSKIDDKEKFVKELISVFKYEKGIQFKILTTLLLDDGIIEIGDREFRKYLDASQKVFIQDVGTYQGVNDKFKDTANEKEFYKKDIGLIRDRLKSLSKKYITPQ